MTVRFSVTVRQVLEDGSEVPLEGELAAALAGPAEQFAGLAAWAAEEARYLDHGEREKVIGQEGRELQRRLLQATFDLDAAREERAGGRSPARPGSGTAPSRPGTAGAWPACSGRSGSPGWPTATAASRTCTRPTPAGPARRPVFPGHAGPGGLPPGRRRVRAGPGGHRGPHRRHGRPRPAHRPGRGPRRLDGRLLRGTLPRRGRREQPDSDVIMMQADGKGIAMRPEHRKNAGKADAAHPGIKKMAEIVAVADFTPAVREPEDIAAPPARRQAHPGPKARDKWVSASVTESIEDMIAAAYRRGRPPRPAARPAAGLPRRREQAADHRHPGPGGRTRPRRCPVLIDYIHVSGYLGKAAAALHPGDPAAAGPVGRRAAAARPARPREGRRRHPRLRRRENPRQPPDPPPRPHRHGQGRHLPDEQPAST